MVWLSKLLFLLTLFSNEDNHRNQFKSTSRKEHKAEKIIQKPLSPSFFFFLIMYQHTIIKQLVTNEVLYKTSSIKTSVPLHRKGLLTLLNKKQV